MTIQNSQFLARLWRFAGAFSVHTIMGIVLALVLLLGVGITIHAPAC